MINLKHAYYVMTILEEGGVTAAAKKLYISQPSLSQTIKSVEDDLGAAIFDRGAKQLTLTCAGKKYVEAMQDAMTIEKNLRNEIMEIKNENSGLLRIGISAQRGISLLPQILPEFIEKYPLVQIELVEYSSGRLEEIVDQGSCDVAFITTTPKQNHIEYRLVENEQIVLMASRRTEIAGRLEEGTEIELNEAKDEKFVNLTPGHSVRVIQDRLTALHHFEPRILLETHNLEAAKLITARVNAVMVCPYSHITGNAALERLTKCYPLRCHGFERHFYFCYRKKLRLPRYMEDLFEIARSKCKYHTM